MARKKVEFTQEQQDSMLAAAKDEDQLVALKRLFGISDPIPPTTEQIQNSAELKEYKGNKYVATPFVKLGEKESAKGAFLRTEVARMVAEEVLRFCDENDL
jgi:hypothetical protein